MYDLAIIGAGAGGIASAKSALKLGLKTVLIEINKEAFGGICLNKGCIPTKFFLRASGPDKEWRDLLNQKQTVIEKIKIPLLESFTKQGLDIIWGQAHFLDKNTIKVNTEKIKAKDIIIASGSSPKAIIPHSKIIFPEDLLNRTVLPDNILIIGAGYIGLELASLLYHFGKTVQIIEKEDRILPAFDAQLTQRLRRVLEKKGFAIQTSVEANNCNFNDFDIVILAVGRLPNTKSLEIENTGIVLDENGWVKTDKYMKTSVDNIYACGDVTGKKLLAYVAEYQGRICVSNISGNLIQEDYRGLPECVFSQPQIAKVGILEEEAKKLGINYRIIKSNFLRFSSSYVYNDNEGFIEVLINEEERIIGAGIISKEASELINIFSLCIRNNLKLIDLKKCFFIHPTLSEIIPLLFN